MSIRPVELDGRTTDGRHVGARAVWRPERTRNVIENNLAAMPPSRREVELLMTGTDPGALQGDAIDLCAKAFGTDPVPVC